jgi:hypothetical protein
VRKKPNIRIIYATYIEKILTERAEYVSSMIYYREDSRGCCQRFKR